MFARCLYMFIRCLLNLACRHILCPGQHSKARNSKDFKSHNLIFLRKLEYLDKGETSITGAKSRSPNIARFTSKIEIF